MLAVFRGAVIVVTLVAAHAVAYACTCEDDGVDFDPVAGAEDYTMVFYGEVGRVRRTGGCGSSSGEDAVFADLRVVEAFKGVAVGDEVVVETVRDSASCGVEFGRGEMWLLYTNGGYGMCSPGGQFESDHPYLEALRAQ